jgi:Right handed beta helix region
MISLKRVTQSAAFLGTLLVCAAWAHATDIGGTISTTLTITEDSQLVDDVICTVAGAPCISIGAPHVKLELNGFTMTGQADARTACNGGPSTFPTPVEDAIDLQGQTDVDIRGPGLIQRFRGPGIFLYTSSRVRVTGVTVSTNCFSGILVGGGSGHEISGNISVRNGNATFGCGGIWLYGGASRSRLRANRLLGNGYTARDNNFGIGLLSAGTNDNVVENNAVGGNTTGLLMSAGVQGNVIRRNLIVGNPPVQLSVENPSTTAVDIQNAAADGANTFEGNICLTSVNAPCPALGRVEPEILLPLK